MLAENHFRHAAGRFLAHVTNWHLDIQGETAVRRSIRIMFFGKNCREKQILRKSFLNTYLCSEKSKIDPTEMLCIGRSQMEIST